ncbi:unnamed protein product [Urochloa humidicola]
MAGGGTRRAGAAEEPKIGTGNVFAALETLKKKKKKPAAAGKGAKLAAEEPKPEVFWAPAPLTTKSWADVEDDDDDDYFATTAPPPRPVWGNDSRGDAAAKDQRDAHALEEEVESEDDGLDDEVEDDADEEHEHDTEDAAPAEPTVKNDVAPPAAPKDTERQLSKKELKKKELAELDAILTELGLGASSNSTQDESNGKKDVDQVTDGEKKGDVPAPENKSSKKKKSKKDKSSKESKEAQEQGNGSEEAAGPEPDEDTASVDVKERIKKVASLKKKKSSKEMDAAAKIAASEAAARSAKLAAAKKKEKSRYNQQPLR